MGSNTAMSLQVTLLLGFALSVQDAPAIELTPLPGTDPEDGIVTGRYEVFENRVENVGRTIHLDVVVMKATGPDPKPDPVFWIAGGPGQRATSLWRGWRQSWMRAERDVVLVDQRGTGGDHALRCDTAGDASDLQAYLDPLFHVEEFERCRKKLEKSHDLRFYTTPLAMDDLDEVRAVLGYETINLMGGSYGTRASLVFLRRHPESVRTVFLNGVAPIAFTNPLYHASEAQAGLERIFAECAADPACAAAFPELEEEFHAVMERLAAKPAEVELQRADGSGTVTLLLDQGAFAEAVRTLMYYLPNNRRVPLLIHQAYGGDYREFARTGLNQNRGIRDSLAIGMLLCVTCAEDLPRVDPDSIAELTAGTFLGDGRVRSQLAVCEIWPKGIVPESYGDPVVSDKPVLVLSGTHDPVTGPGWGAEAARHLSNGLHVVAPGAHGVSGPCIDSIVRAFLERASVEGLDTSCVESMTLPPFELPE